MQINWMTFAAQIINFLVLVWLLKRLLYKPIANAMDERERKIAERLHEADRARQEAERDADAHRRKTAELEHAKEELMAEATREVAAWKDQHLKQAKQKIEEDRKEWFRAIQRERNGFLRDLRRRAARHVFEAARRVIGNLTDAALEEQIVDSFLKRLHDVDQNERARIAEAIRNSRHEVVVRSAFELSDVLRHRVVREVQTSLGNDVDVDFRSVPEVLCGIELQAAGYKVAWSAGESLEAMQEEFEQVLDESPVRNEQ
jgi:F-type H+-transporting ATPase subunit b